MFDEAHEAASATLNDRYRSEALRELGIVLAQAGDERAAKAVFEEAHEAVSAIESDEIRMRAARELAVALTKAGRYEDAREAASAIEWDEARTEALRDLAIALARVGDESAAKAVFDEAREAARAIADDQYRSEALREMGIALAKAGHLVYALATVLDVGKLDEFLQALATYATSLEQVETGLSIDTIREATGIAGWVRQDWHETHELL
jgi:tetratricopeptide (TPR) repeat protein